MAHMLVDRNRCSRDGLCTQFCGRGLIALEDGWPTFADKDADRCNRCGQCVAFCPQGAISLQHYDHEPVRRLEPGLEVSPEQAAQLLRGRRSIRRYKPAPVPRETVMDVLETARMAPTGGNNQLVSWMVIHETSLVQQLAAEVVEWFDQKARHDAFLRERYAVDEIVTRCRAGEDVILRGAPHLVLATTPSRAAWGAVDSAIALTYFELGGWAHGIGTCWAGYFIRACAVWQPLRDLLGLDDDTVVQGALMFGFPRFMPHSIPVRNPLKLTWK